MATSLNIRPETRPEGAMRGVMSSASAQQAVGSRWEMRLTLGQLVITWAVVAGVMVMVFLFGFFSGRDQGLRTALDQQGDQVLRLPVPRALAGAQQPEDSGRDIIAKNETRSSEAAPQNQKGEVKFDFTGSTLVAPAVKATPEPQPAYDAPAPRASEPKPAEPTQKNSAPAATDERKTEAALANEQGAFLNKLAGGQEAVPPKTSSPTVKSEENNRKPAKAQEKAAIEPKQSKKSSEENKKNVLKTAEPPAASVSTAANVPSGWYVQIAATTAKTDSDLIVRNLRSEGVSSQIQQAQVGKSTYFRVLSGPFPSYDDAQTAQKRIKALKVSPGEPFLKRVN